MELSEIRRRIAKLDGAQARTALYYIAERRSIRMREVIERAITIE